VDIGDSRDGILLTSIYLRQDTDVISSIPVATSNCLVIESNTKILCRLISLGNCNGRHVLDVATQTNT